MIPRVPRVRGVGQGDFWSAIGDIVSSPIGSAVVNAGVSVGTSALAQQLGLYGSPGGGTSPTNAGPGLQGFSGGTTPVYIQAPASPAPPMDYRPFIWGGVGILALSLFLNRK
jgi:hypothetical protein